MVNQILLCAGAALPLFWGLAHLFPTKSVVKGFGDISADSKKIIEMESIVEGLTLVFIRAVVLAVSLIDRTSAVSKAVYLLSFVTLNVLSVVSLKTGFKINFPPFRLCPVIFTTASIMILLGSYM
jgi:hypothetical protein